MKHKTSFLCTLCFTAYFILLGLNSTNQTFHHYTIYFLVISTVTVQLHCPQHILHVQAPHSLFVPCGDRPSIENSSILNQYDSSTTNFYSDFKFNLPSYNKLNYVIKDSSNNLKVYHQNIRGVRGKLSQLSNILYSELPHIICITDHHLKDFEMDISIEYYKLGTKFCRQLYKHGGVCIFIHESID
jgi:hypothetical protein